MSLMARRRRRRRSSGIRLLSKNKTFRQTAKKIDKSGGKLRPRRYPGSIADNKHKESERE